MMTNRDKKTSEAFAEGYQQALRDVIAKWVEAGPEAAHKWCEDNADDHTREFIQRAPEMYAEAQQAEYERENPEP